MRVYAGKCISIAKKLGVFQVFIFEFSLNSLALADWRKGSLLLIVEKR